MQLVIFTKIRLVAWCWVAKHFLHQYTYIHVISEFMLVVRDWVLVMMQRIVCQCDLYSYNRPTTRTHCCCCCLSRPRTRNQNRATTRSKRQVLEVMSDQNPLIDDSVCSLNLGKTTARFTKNPETRSRSSYCSIAYTQSLPISLFDSEDSESASQ